MSVSVVGLNPRSAPVHLLEQVAVGIGDIPKVLHAVRSGHHVREAAVVSI